MKVQNFIVTSRILYLLYHLSLGNHTRCADLLFLIIKPNTTKWALLTAAVSLGTQPGGWGEYFAAQSDKPCFCFVLFFGGDGNLSSERLVHHSEITARTRLQPVTLPNPNPRPQPVGYNSLASFTCGSRTDAWDIGLLLCRRVS